MRLLPRCHEVIAFTALVAGALPVQAITINFSGTLINATCELNLDKSTLALGDIPWSDMRADTLLVPQKFVLSISQCTDLANTQQKPRIKVTGTGVTQDSKWLFRSASSAKGTGILVFQRETQPDYSHAEIKSGDTIELIKQGNRPNNQTLTFYAGASCGGKTGCASRAPGEVSATLMFSFEYL